MPIPGNEYLIREESMVTRKLLHVLIAALAMVLFVGSMAFSAAFIWAKGEIHDHTTNSDGNGSAQQVVCLLYTSDAADE